MLLDVRPDHLKIVQDILGTHVPDREVWAFGSRVTGNATETSDLDLAVFGETPLDFETLAALRDAFSESRLPYKVDVVDWSTIGETFKNIILKNKIVIKKNIEVKKIWPEFPLEKCMSTIIDYRGKTPRKASSGIPLITAKIIKAGRIEKPTEFIDQKEYIKWISRGISEPGDIVVTTEAPLGEVAQLNDQKVALAQRVITLRGKSGFLNNTFLKFLMQSDYIQDQLKSRATGTTVVGIRQSEIRKIWLPLPPLPEQRAIAHILGTLDDKIELNRRMNETLEAMAQAIFKSWFVDFDPVRAKMEGRETGLPKEIEDLFPDSFEDSELGEIPRGWRVGSIGESFNIIMGQSPPGESYNTVGEGIPFYQGSADFGSRFPKRRIFCSSPKRFANAGDTLISVRAPVGEINMALEDCCIGRGVAAARHNTMSRSYTYYFMYVFAEMFDHFEAEGTVFGSINKNDFHNIQCIVPPVELIKSYEKTISILDSHVENNDRTVQSLSTLRDILLPKLLSGDIRIKDPENLLKLSTSALSEEK